MRFSDRSIKIAFEKVSGEILDADTIFNTYKDAFEVRNLYHAGGIDLYCCECEQKLTVSNSKYDRLHFKHLPHHAPCILTDNDFTPQELKTFTDALIAKESKRHKELKNKIGERLKLIEGIDTASVSIDKHFITRGEEKRRPDVYCKYKDKELVFEIQLSDLSLRYILDRYNFYRKNGMYLIWVLDNFDVHAQSQMARDLKYLSSYHNFFKLDETVEEFKLACEYKVPFIANDNAIHLKWLKKSVSLMELFFDEAIFQAYYFDLPGKTADTEIELKKHLAAIAEAEKQRREAAKLMIAKEKSQKIIDYIRQARIRKWPDFSSAKTAISELAYDEIGVFNSMLNLTKATRSGQPALHQWISSAKTEDIPFIRFILGENRILLNVNELDGNGVSALQVLYENNNILPYSITRPLFERGYNLSDGDRQYLSSQPQGKQYITFYGLCSRLNDKSLIEFLFNNEKLILVIESAKQNEIIGFSYPADGWIAFANNAIHNRSKYWEYIEPAFKFYGLWDKLIALDKNGTFQKKLEKFYSNMPEQNYDFDPVFKELYPEVYEASFSH